MAQGSIKNPLVSNLFEKLPATSIRPWHLRTVIAPFGIIDMTIDHTRVRPGEIVTVLFKAINTSDFTTIYPISLKINYEVIAAEVISLPRKSVIPMKFVIAKTLPGNYRVDINNSVDTFTVSGTALENEIAKLEGFRTDIGTIEASLDETTPQPEEELKPTVSSSPQPVQQREFKVIKHKPSRRSTVQSGIDKIADGIESGLDKTGDIITYPIEKLLKFSASLYKGNKKK